MKKEQIQTWYQEECQKGGYVPETAHKTPFYQKMVAFTLLFSVPVTLSGCGDDQLTAEDECEWERETNGQWEIDCEDDASSWYRSHGYSSKFSKINPSSPFLKTGVGSGGKKSGGFFSGG